MWPFLPDVLSELGYALLERRGDGSIGLLAPPPSWFAELWPSVGRKDPDVSVAELSPFLENFLFEARAFWDSSAKGFCQSETWVERTPSGREIPVRATAFLADGKPLLALQSPEFEFRERSQLLQTARDFQLVHERLLREIQKKEILLHCIIHDLSQPLSVMSVAFDSISREGTDSRAQRFLELGKLASAQQLSMIREILQVFSADLKTALEAETRTESAPDLLRCARSVIESFSPVLAAKQIRLELDPRVGTSAAWRVRGEESRLCRIYSNFLENALRYAPAGSRVTIGIANDGAFLKTFVDDEGPGLPADLRPSQLFALLSKGKDGGGKAGLGLYFCRVTVERWGGTIGGENLPDKGSRFWFRLPKADLSAATADSAHPASSVARPAPSSTKRPLNVLLAEDQAELRELTRYQLESAGHSVTVAGNGKEAVRALDSGSFDAVLLDEEMPVMNGVAAVRAIREHKTYPRSRPVLVAVTGNTTDADRERLLGAGFDFVLPKPLRMDALDGIFHEGSGRGGATPSPAVAPPPTTGLEELLHRVGGDGKLLRRMIQTFLRDTPGRMSTIERGIRRSDGESVAAAAHALKGSVSIFGAEAARVAAQELQESGRQADFTRASKGLGPLKEEIAKLEENLRGYAGRNRSRITGASQKPKSAGRRAVRKKRK